VNEKRRRGNNTKELGKTESDALLAPTSETRPASSVLVLQHFSDPGAGRTSLCASVAAVTWTPC
jgi:hypothetical protein